MYAAKIANCTPQSYQIFSVKLQVSKNKETKVRTEKKKKKKKTIENQ